MPEGFHPALLHITSAILYSWNAHESAVRVSHQEQSSDPQFRDSRVRLDPSPKGSDARRLASLGNESRRCSALVVPAADPKDSRQTSTGAWPLCQRPLLAGFDGCPRNQFEPGRSTILES